MQYVEGRFREAPFREASFGIQPDDLHVPFRASPGWIGSNQTRTLSLFALSGAVGADEAVPGKPTAQRGRTLSRSTL